MLLSLLFSYNKFWFLKQLYLRVSLSCSLNFFSNLSNLLRLTILKRCFGKKVVAFSEEKTELKVTSENAKKNFYCKKIFPSRLPLPTRSFGPFSCFQYRACYEIENYVGRTFLNLKLCKKLVALLISEFNFELIKWVFS